MALSLSRNAKFVVTDGTDTQEIGILDGFSFSQSTGTQNITLNEAGSAPKRGQQMFNTSLEPVDWSVTTYVRPLNDGTTDTAVEKIKSGGGPQFIEFSTYRWLEHCGPNYDNDIGYRTEKEFLEWKEKDPIKLCEEKLLDIADEPIKNYRNKTQADIEKAFHFAKQSPFPDPEETYTNLFADGQKK